MSEKLTNMLEPASNDNSLAGLLKRPEYSKRFEAVLGERAPQFASSLITIGNTMKDVEPRSILGSAMIAAALDLPIDKNLGFAWIVPYKGVATFQMGYRGYIQLGMRSAQYKRMNATGINVEVFKGWDSVGEPVLDWDNYDPEKEIWGYFFGFELVNGFTKVAVWTKEKVHAHAQKYSQAYRAGKDIWKLQFDGMALKTVIANTLRKWGPMSIQLQRALQSDSAVIRDIDAEPTYIDNGPDTPEKPEFDHPAKKEQESEQKATEKADPKKGSAIKTKPLPVPEPKVLPKAEPPIVGVDVTVKEAEQAPALAGPLAETKESEPMSEPQPPGIPESELPPELMPEPEPEKEKVATESQLKLKDEITAAGFTFEDLGGWARTTPMPLFKTNPPKRWEDIPDDKAKFFVAQIKGIAAAIKGWKAKK